MLSLALGLAASGSRASGVRLHEGTLEMNYNLLFARRNMRRGASAPNRRAGDHGLLRTGEDLRPGRVHQSPRSAGRGRDPERSEPARQRPDFAERLALESHRDQRREGVDESPGRPQGGRLSRAVARDSDRAQEERARRRLLQRGRLQAGDRHGADGARLLRHRDADAQGHRQARPPVLGLRRPRGAASDAEPAADRDTSCARCSSTRSTCWATTAPPRSSSRRMRRASSAASTPARRCSRPCCSPKPK